MIPAMPRDDCLEALRKMLLIRRFEEKVEERFRAGELPGFLHVAIGQEACAVGVCRALEDGDVVSPKEVVLRIRARYRAFGLYETAVLGMLAQSTGWATAARECVDAAAPQPVICFGARHVHPDGEWVDLRSERTLPLQGTRSR